MTAPRRKVITFFDDFRRAQTLSTTPGHNGWTLKDTSAAGSPTAAIVAGGGMELDLAATSEAEHLTMYFNDILVWALEKLQIIEFVVMVDGIDSVTTLTMGVASAQNNTPDNIANSAWFRMEGSASTTAVVVETDDSVNDNNDVATGKTLAGTELRMTIDFTRGLSDIRFAIDNEPVAQTTTFNMSNASGNNVQPFVQLSKASGTGTPTVTIKQFMAQYEIAD